MNCDSCWIISGRLKAQLSSLPEDGSSTSAAPDFSRPNLASQPQRVVVEKVVEKVVMKKGVDEAKVRELEENTIKAKKYAPFIKLAYDPSSCIRSTNFTFTCHHQTS
jgi:hypothetical protein